MDNFLDAVARRGRKLKERLRGKGDKRDKSRANTTEESIGPSSSFLRPGPPIAAGGHDREGSRASTEARQVHSRGRSPQPEPVPVGGRDDDGERKEVDVDKKEVGQDHSDPEPNVETAMGGGLGPTEVRPLSPSSFTPTLVGGKSDST